MKKLKLYLDTSIPNHLFAEDTPERMRMTKWFLKNITQKTEEYELYISDVVVKEINRAPEEKKRKLFFALKNMVVLRITPECDSLAKEYLKAGVIPDRYGNDAYHIAIATVYELDILVSWNFEHMVNFKTRKKVNAINTLLGYKNIEIITPEEVI